MTGFNSPFARRSALVLTLTGGALGLFSARNAQGQQNAYDQAKQKYDNCISAACQRDAEREMLSADKTVDPEQMQRMMEIGKSTSKQIQKTIQIQVDTPENRQFANRVYTAAFAGIDKVLKTQGKDKALEFSQHPENNPALMTIVKQAREGQFILAAIVISDVMVDSKAYIDNNGNGGLPTLNNSRWSSTASGTQEYLSIKAGNTSSQVVSELSFLKTNQDNSNLFGPKTKIAARFVVMMKDAPLQTASLRVGR